ncbi:methylenetetrahydrofolate reductase [Flectobacillus rivi]|uniref:Methylenetetrahydrofolate reductase n=1 Tax=Flectobacillus rivi TaxID=2984209 RepID=A0ABT6Z274_9BACT|nr:methylenetetrahydrofolate reductase [Flectobacillus rivi]MDI9875240.1 methylenetetrahydrofolate reductase [Flectobacillus rivi]
MFLDKIKSKESGILLYGITPPKAQVGPEKVVEIAEKTLARLHNLDIDALVVYDVQDESARTSEERPFPFISAHDPFEFAKNHLSSLQVPKIIYRPAGKFTKEELNVWLSDVVAHGFSPVFVGVPSPDFVPVTSLPEAYSVWRQYQDQSVIGAVTIPERHAVLKDEDQRILDKVSSGVSYFISQCVFNVDYAKAMLDALVQACEAKNQEIPTIIFTLTACGSVKTLHFMEWLGIHIPEELKEEFKTSENILDRSVEVCITIAEELIKYGVQLGVPVGFNIESVAIRKEEIEASIAMVNQIGEMLKAEGLRK